MLDLLEVRQYKIERIICIFQSYMFVAFEVQSHFEEKTKLSTNTKHKYTRE